MSEMMKTNRALIAATLLAIASGLPLTALAEARTEVFVLGTLYKRHETTPAYDLQALRRIILDIGPDVLVVDCTPTEVRELKVHPSKVEYPGAIFPLAHARGYPMYAAEPDEPLFTELVQSQIDVRESVRKKQPEKARAADEYGKFAYSVLAEHWRSPADVHDETTAVVLEGKQQLEALVFGPVARDGQIRWDQHWTDVILRAAAENPGKRVLALTGIQNRKWIADALQVDGSVEVVDMTRWLRDHARST
jgi:hypothetical protein